MKKLYFVFLIIFFAVTAKGQSNPVDELFEKYNEKEGFTVVYISGKMLEMFSDNAASDGSGDIMKNTRSIKVLTEDDGGRNGSVNFYDELKGKLDFDQYEELMVVREADEITKMLVKYSNGGNTISEFLLISSGEGGNTLISITGELDIKDLSGFSNSLGVSGLEQLEGM